MFKCDSLVHFIKVWRDGTLTRRAALWHPWYGGGTLWRRSLRGRISATMASQQSHGQTVCSRQYQFASMIYRDGARLLDSVLTISSSVQCSRRMFCSIGKNTVRASAARNAYLYLYIQTQEVSHGSKRKETKSKCDWLEARVPLQSHCTLWFSLTSFNVVISKDQLIHILPVYLKISTQNSSISAI